MLLVQLLDEAVNLGLAEDNVAKKVRSPRVPKVQRRTLSPAEVARLVSVCDERYVAAVASCFVQGWRVSEALGLAWQDLDLDAGTVRLRRGATYADGIGMLLGAPKTSRTAGRQLLAPTTLTLLAAHHDRWHRLREKSGSCRGPRCSDQGEFVARPRLREPCRTSDAPPARRQSDPQGCGCGRARPVGDRYAHRSPFGRDKSLCVGRPRPRGRSAVRRPLRCLHDAW